MECSYVCVSVKVLSFENEPRNYRIIVDPNNFDDFMAKIENITSRFKLENFRIDYKSMWTKCIFAKLDSYDLSIFYFTSNSLFWNEWITRTYTFFWSFVSTHVNARTFINISIIHFTSSRVRMCYSTLSRNTQINNGFYPFSEHFALIIFDVLYNFSIVLVRTTRRAYIVYSSSLACGEILSISNLHYQH